MSSAKARSAGIVVLGLGLLLAACTGSRPFVTVPAKAVQRAVEETYADRTPPPRAIAICHSGLVNTEEEVLEEARLVCPTGRVVFQEDDLLWTRCPLLQPVRANFLCFRDEAGDRDTSTKTE